jgi:hypothetical protein
MLISIALLAVVATIMAGALRLALRNLSGGEKKIEHLERLSKSVPLIEEQMLSAMPLTFADDDGVRHFYFRGREDGVTVPTTFSIWNGRAGYVVVEYRVHLDADGTWSLWASERTVMTGKARETRMLHGLRDVGFEYFHKDPTEENGDWVKEWTEETSTPQKVRVRIASGTREIILTVPFNQQGDMGVATPAKVARPR